MYHLIKSRAQEDVARFNEIQAEWMALDPHASDNEKAEVLTHMKLIPPNFINVSADGLNGVIHIGAQPLWPSPRSIECCQVLAEQYHVRTDIAWCGEKGVWVVL